MDDGRPRSFDPHNRPPPPNHAQGLVARSGYTVYESGTSLFDQPVLVYEASREFPNVHIFDHLGKPMGRAVKEHRGWLSNGPIRFFDNWGNEVLQMRQQVGLGDPSYSITGVVNAKLSASLTGGRITITQNGMVHGELSGGGIMGAAGNFLKIFDPAHRKVGEVKGHHEYHYFLSSVYSYVISVDPSIRGPLRQALVAVPVAMGMTRRRRHNS